MLKFSKKARIDTIHNRTLITFSRWVKSFRIFYTGGRNKIFSKNVNKLRINEIHNTLNPSSSSKP